MERAALLLGNGDRPISRIAALTGYPEYQTFERQFRRFYGRTPGEFRASGTITDGEGAD
jgi:AraC-like DNA-binding protein